MLNNEAMVKHHYEALGFFSPALGDYVNHNIMPHEIGTDKFRHVVSIEDPFSYRNRPRMKSVPKYILNAAGDQFFLPDSAQFYFQDLPGVKHLRYVPNTDHSLKGSDAWMTLLACYSAVVKGTKTPQFSWTLEDDGSIRVLHQDQPDAVKLWQATNPDARDFRLETIGAAWQSSDLKDVGGGVHVAKVAKPEKGWTAFFAELTYGSGTATPFKFTTQVRVVPDVKPFKYQPPTRPR